MSNVVMEFLKSHNREKSEKTQAPELFSPAVELGNLLAKRMQEDPHFYLFSPDETTSNKLDAVFDVEKRAWSLPIAKWDLPEADNGRIVEMLSENVLFSVMTGHILNGEQAMMTSYEAFFPVITSQLLQQMKFFKQCNATSWRKKYPAINLLSTSTCWRQDHNGFTHQSPALISTLLAVPSNLANCLFPVDDIAAREAFYFMLNTRNVVNLTTFNKIELPRWIDINHARFQLTNGGASIFQFISDDNPDIIVTGIGDIPTREAIEGIKLAKQEVPELRVRYVGIAALSYGAIGTTENKLKPRDFDDYFTIDKPIIVNFHGYPETAFSIFSHYAHSNRLDIHGYEDQGSTTSPMDELARNHCSRYDIAASILERSGHYGFMRKFQDIIVDNADYASQFGVDKQ